jgi:hypothetical protein
VEYLSSFPHGIRLTVAAKINNNNSNNNNKQIPVFHTTQYLSVKHGIFRKKDKRLL